MKPLFYRCPVCGNVLLKVAGSSVVPSCCGRPMQQLDAAVMEGNTEYHIPVVECCANGKVRVTVGHSPHPMTSEHYIQFIYLETEHGGMIQYLRPGEEATATFCTHEAPVAIYACCNLHGLWQKIPCQR